MTSFAEANFKKSQNSRGGVLISGKFGYYKEEVKR
jgi:hypothetical protein